MTAPDAPQAKFPLGELLMTPGAAEAFEKAGERWSTFLLRHVHGDWGELDADDVQENELSLQHGFRLLSKYSLGDKTVIWIITEADRSATTILLPEEY
jgi:hypothetical protein